MSRKDYVSIARVLQEANFWNLDGPQSEDAALMLHKIVEGLETVFKTDNPNFDKGRFRAAVFLNY